MINYLIRSFKKKKARRVTQEYPDRIDLFDLPDIGVIEFANWSNPLVKPVKLTMPLLSFFKQFIKEGDMVIDIGANIGDTTVPMGLCAGNTGLTLGFDPNPRVYKILEKNATLNAGKMNIVPVPYAISKEEEDFYFISSEASFGNGGISKTRESNHGKFIYPDKVKGINLEEYLEKKHANRLDRLSFIKIDTEGYDKEIIKSIKNLLTKYKPVVVAESFGKATNEDKMELYEVIAELGYDIYYFQDFDINAKVLKLNAKEDMTNWKDTINIYAIPKSII